MRSHTWYVAHSFCADRDQNHSGEPILAAITGDLIGHICPNCLERVRHVRRGSDLWILEADE